MFLRFYLLVHSNFWAYILNFRVGSAVCCYFCIWDLRRASDPVYKKNLYEKRKEAYSQSLCRPITEKLLKPLVEKYGSLDILKHPMQGLVLLLYFMSSKSHLRENVTFGVEKMIVSC